MTVAGLPTWQVWLKPDGVNWIEVTASLDGDIGIGERPLSRATVGGRYEPGELTFTLIDPVGTWWPESPTSVYFPNVTEGMSAKFLLTIGAASAYIYGRVSGLVPTISESALTGSTVAFTVNDNTADGANFTLDDWFTAFLRQTGVAHSVQWSSWPFTDETATAGITNANKLQSPASIIQTQNRDGSLTFNDLEGLTNIGTWNLPRMATFTPAVDSAGQDIPLTPVIICPVTAATSGQFYLAFRAEKISDHVLMEARASDGTPIWSYRFNVANGGLDFYDNASSTFYSVTGNLSICDGYWHTIVMVDATSHTPGPAHSYSIYIDGVGIAATVANYDTSSIRALIVGGSCDQRKPGKQTLCFNGDVAMLGCVAYGQLGGAEWAAVTKTIRAIDAAQRLDEAGLPFLLSHTAGLTAGVDVFFPKLAPGTKWLDAVNQLIDTAGGGVWWEFTAAGQKFHWMFPDGGWYDPTPIATITLEQDDLGSIELSRGLELRPTRGIVTGTKYSSTYIDYAAETKRRLDSDTIATWSATQADADAVAAALVLATPGRGLHITSMEIDLTTGEGGQAVATALLAAIPGHSVLRVAGLPAQFGRTYDDYVIQTWDRRWRKESCIMTVSLVKVSDTPITLHDSTVPNIGRYGAGVGSCTTQNGSALGTGTSPGLIVYTGSVSSTFDMSRQLYWNWNGECVAGTFNNTRLNANYSFDVDVSSWYPLVGATAIARVTSPVHSGAGSMQVTSGAGTAPRAESAALSIPISPWSHVAAYAWLRQDTGIARVLRVAVNWYDGSLAYLRSDAQVISCASGVWQFFAADWPVSAGAAFANLSVGFDGAPGAGLVMYADECELWTNSGTSPQTLAITARGQLGTIARTHVDNESFDLWNPARYGY